MAKFFSIPKSLPRLAADRKALYAKCVRYLVKADKAYHDLSEPIVSDAIYDEVKTWLWAKNGANPYFKKVGHRPTFGQEKELPSAMGSLAKKRPSEVVQWIDSLGDQPEIADFNKNQYWYLPPKFDGVPIECVYQDGELIEASTRGDGFIGRAVTENSRYIQGVLPRLPSDTHPLYQHLNKGRVIVKGECIMHLSIFNEKYKGKPNPLNAKKKLKSARNMVGGCLNRVPRNGKVSPQAQAMLADCTFLAFSISKIEKKREVCPPLKHQEYVALMAMGFTTVTNPVRYGKGHYRIQELIKAGKLAKSCRNLLPVWEEQLPIKVLFRYDEINEDMIKSLMETNKKLIDAEQDGLVATPMHTHWGRERGTLPDGKSPRWMTAIKLEQADQKKLVGTIARIEGRTTRRRVIKPRIFLKEKLDFGAAEVEYATAHNFGNVRDLKLAPGVKIDMIRSGDVIPYVLGVSKGSKKKKAAIPTKCPACGGRVTWNKTKVDLVCTNLKCSGSQEDKLNSFFFAIGVKWLGEGIMDQLRDSGHDTVLKILRLKPADLMKIEGFGKAKANKIVNSIHEALDELPLARVMYASGCFTNQDTSLGETRLEAILSELGQEKALELTAVQIRKKLAGVNGIGAVILDLFLRGLPRFVKFYGRINKYVTLSEPDEPEGTSLAGVTVAFTEFRDDEMEAKIKANGGKIGGVSRNCAVLFYGKEGSSKWNKAQSMIAEGHKIKLVPQAKAWDWINKRIK